MPKGDAPTEDEIIAAIILRWQKKKKRSPFWGFSEPHRRRCAVGVRMIARRGGSGEGLRLPPTPPRSPPCPPPSPVSPNPRQSRSRSRPTGRHRSHLPPPRQRCGTDPSSRLSPRSIPPAPPSRSSVLGVGAPAAAKAAAAPSGGGSVPTSRPSSALRRPSPAAMSPRHRNGFSAERSAFAALPIDTARRDRL